jgi:TonB family protein
MWIKEEEKNIISAILATILVHLMILIACLIFRIHKEKTIRQEQIVIEFDMDVFNAMQQSIKENKPPEKPENNYLSQDDVKNIAVNTADKIEQEISTDKYIKEVKEELGIKDPTPPKEVITTADEKSISVEKNIYKPSVKEKIVTYKGPTRITCFLENRKIRYTQVPVYICQGGGTVIVAIIVDPKGQVIDASIESTNSNEECFSEAALQAAKLTLFSIDLNAEPREKGTLSYEFVPQ